MSAHELSDVEPRYTARGRQTGRPNCWDAICKCDQRFRASSKKQAISLYDYHAASGDAL